MPQKRRPLPKHRHHRPQKKRNQNPRKPSSETVITSVTPQYDYLILKDKDTLVKKIIEQEATIDRLAKSIKRHAEIEVDDTLE